MAQLIQCAPLDADVQHLPNARDVTAALSGAATLHIILYCWHARRVSSYASVGEPRAKFACKRFARHRAWASLCSWLPMIPMLRRIQARSGSGVVVDDTALQVRCMRQPIRDDATTMRGRHVICLRKKCVSVRCAWRAARDAGAKVATARQQGTKAEDDTNTTTMACPVSVWFVSV